MDTQGKTAEWWAEEAERCRWEARRANENLDRVIQEKTEQGNAYQKSLHEQDARLKKQHATEKERLVKIQDSKIKQLQAEHDKAVQQLLQEPAELRELRLKHQAEAQAIVKQQAEERQALHTKMATR